MHDISLNKYEKFTALERANLTMLALGRNDTKEADRLLDSCPRHSYTAMLDNEYSCNMLAIGNIKYLFYEQCVYYYNILAKIDSTIMLIEATSWQTWEKEEAAYNKMSASHDLYVSRLKAVYQGLMQFCEEVELDCDGMLKTIGVENSCPDVSEYLDEDVCADPAYIETVRALFSECWDLK